MPRNRQFFDHKGRRLAYEIRGEGDRTVVLLHGLTLPGHVNGIVADMLVERGNRVVMLDLLGHGDSDKARHASEHRLEYAAQQVIALLDHLEIEQAVVGGMSLGANVTLEVAVRYPERTLGAICEMPVLERGLMGVSIALFPLLVGLRFGGPLVRGLFGAVRRLPRTGHDVVDAVLDTGSNDPRAMAAIMHGYATGPVCPPKEEREAIEAPILVIGHKGDVMHPMDDAEALIAEVPNGRLVQSRSFFELRTKPARLVGEMADFLDEVFDARDAAVAKATKVTKAKGATRKKAAARG